MPEKLVFEQQKSTGMTIQGFTQETASAPEVVENTSEAEIASEQMTVTLDAQGVAAVTSGDDD